MLADVSCLNLHVSRLCTFSKLYTEGFCTFLDIHKIKSKSKQKNPTMIIVTEISILKKRVPIKNKWIL